MVVYLWSLNAIMLLIADSYQMIAIKSEFLMQRDLVGCNEEQQ
jgi:hypothetical protein